VAAGPSGGRAQEAEEAAGGRERAALARRCQRHGAPVRHGSVHFPSAAGEGGAPFAQQ